MSYDLQVWSVRPLRENTFQDRESWARESALWSHVRKNWQIVISASDRVEPEDIPEDVTKLLPGIEYLTNLNLEGKRTAEGFRLAQSIANEIARDTHGAVLDPQEDSVRLPSGVKRLLLPRSKDVFDVVSMSWWFLDGPLLSREGRQSFVGLLERMLPEALPRRYGLYEPPQHVYAKAGRAHFLDFWDTNLHDMMVLYPQRPVTSVHVGCPLPLGAFRIGFRTNYLQIEVERKALLEPGWESNLKQFWKRASVLIRPIYGDVRIMSGYCWVGATATTQFGQGEQHPVQSWWWTGLPRTLGSAVVIGDIYQRLWPDFLQSGTAAEGLAFASTNDWSIRTDLVHLIGEPPEAQAQRSTAFTADKQQYPTGWPFENPVAL